MPVHKTPSGKWQWGSHGHEYASKAGAERQAEAAYANGYRGDFDNQDWPQSSNESTRLENDESGGPSEIEIINKLRKGELKSPVRYGPLWLFAMRVTGTGIAYRPQHEEWVYRPPRYYLNEKFLERVNGLPILLGHAEGGPVQGDEFHERSIGVLVSPWIKGDEVWGVAKIYADEDAALIVEKFPSTSPSVTFGVGVGKMEKLPNGETYFHEGPPQYIDHLAVVAEGVWDKYNGPSGVDLNTLSGDERDDERNSTGAESAGMAPYSWRP